MEIKTSADWPNVERVLIDQMRSIKHNRDINQMKRNVEKMISDLNRAEVDARRIKNFKYLEPKIKEINEAIAVLETMIFVLILRS